MARSLTVSQMAAENRAYSATRRIFARYGADPVKDPPERLAKAMNRMKASEVECIAAAQRMVMRMNGVEPKWKDA